MPKSNTDFWEAKIARNRKRDKENYRVLQENGWHVIVIWECQLKPAVIEHTMREVALLLEENMLTLYKKAKPSPYFFKEDKESFPMAAEESPCLGE